MKKPSPGSCLGGAGRPGGHGADGRALITTRRRTPVACIASAIARVPLLVMPAAAFAGRPSPDDRVGPADRRLQRRRVGRRQVGDYDARCRVCRLCGVPDHGGDVVARRPGPGQQLPTDPAGGREIASFTLIFLLLVPGIPTRRAGRVHRPDGYGEPDVTGTRCSGRGGEAPLRGPHVCRYLSGTCRAGGGRALCALAAVRTWHFMQEVMARAAFHRDLWVHRRVCAHAGGVGV